MGLVEPAPEAMGEKAAMAENEETMKDLGCGMVRLVLEEETAESPLVAEAVEEAVEEILTPAAPVGPVEGEEAEASFCSL